MNTSCGSPTKASFDRIVVAMSSLSERTMNCSEQVQGMSFHSPTKSPASKSWIAACRDVDFARNLAITFPIWLTPRMPKRRGP